MFCGIKAPNATWGLIGAFTFELICLPILILILSGTAEAFKPVCQPMYSTVWVAFATFTLNFALSSVALYAYYSKNLTP